jgi:hypothetical protein
MRFISLLVTGFVVVVVYVVSHHALKTFTSFGPARLLAAIVALLSGLSVLSMGNSVVTVMLIPYPALGLSLLFLPLLERLLQRNWGRDLEHRVQGRPLAPLRRRNAGTGGSRKAMAPISAHTCETSRSQK